jgi:hypothetical protein
MSHVELFGKMKDSGDRVFDVEFIRVAAPAAEELNFIVIVAGGGSFRSGATAKAVAGETCGIEAGRGEGQAEACDEGLVVKGLAVRALEKRGIAVAR